MPCNVKSRVMRNRGLKLARVSRQEMAKVDGGVTCRTDVLADNSQQFTIVSDILKTMHEAAKNAV